MTKKKSPTKKTIQKATTAPITRRPLAALRERRTAFLARRPHRSFQRTRCRDYARSLSLPGYVAFSVSVFTTLKNHKKTLLLLSLFYAVLTGVMVGVASQDTYTALTDTLRSTGDEVFSGNFGEIGKASLLFVSAITGGTSQTLTEVQQVYAGLIALLTWLTTVWLLRNILAGHKVNLRDGLYNGSAPFLSTFVVALVFVVQLLPLALALIGYSAAVSSGLLAGGVEAMLFWFAASLLALLSVYWVTSTFIALVIVTLPGMYPFTALRTAGDMVVGRRLRILLRMVWLGLTIVVSWAVIMIPIILLDAWIKSVWSAITWLPIIPFSLLVMGSLTIVWAASYVYLLYRKVVADDASPA